MILLFRLAVLRKWRTKYGPTATYRNLAKCFYQADMQSMVQTICQALGAPGKELFPSFPGLCAMTKH